MSYAYAGNYETGTHEYRNTFLNFMRHKGSAPSSTHADASGYTLPESTHSLYEKAIEKKNPFRRLATVKAAYSTGYNILARVSDDLALWVAEGGNIPIYDGIDDFTTYTVANHKLACATKLSEEFIHDASFDLEDYLVDRFSGNFAKAEEKAFIVGTGTNEPTGILHATAGAQVGLTAANTTRVTFNEVISLYFSVKPEYRQSAVWVMNDETVTALRTLMDENGSYLWNQTHDTILGRPVVISNYMPSMAAGKKAIAFGDFSYYWVIDRSPIHIKPLTEKFALNGMVCYLATEFMDAKLIRPEAIKVLKMKAE